MGITTIADIIRDTFLEPNHISKSMINAATGSSFISWSGISINSAISLYFAAHIPRITPKTIPAIRPVPIFIMLCISVT